MTQEINKLRVFLRSKGIRLSLNDTTKTKAGIKLNNVVLEKKGKVMKIAHKCFYGTSGMSRAWKKVRGGTGREAYDFVKITEDMHFNEHIRSLIMLYFEGNNRQQLTIK